MAGQLPPLNWLRAFEAAARHLSFTQAARELNMTQSAVSQQIKALEGYLGRALFLREARAVQLTDAARSYLPTVQSAFVLLGRETEILRGSDSDTVLEIHANLAFTLLWLTPRIDAFIEENPWIHLNLSTSVWTSEFTRPYASVEIRFGSGEWEGITGERLCEQSCFPVASPALAQQLDTPAALTAQPLLEVSGTLDGWDSWLKSLGIAYSQKAVAHRSSTFVVTLELAKRGLGVALGHEIIAADSLAAGDLIAPFQHRQSMQQSYYLITPPGRSMNPAAKTFSDWVQAQFAR
jgi:LysR family glycine cleavage system transcriptional activator